MKLIDLLGASGLDQERAERVFTGLEAIVIPFAAAGANSGKSTGSSVSGSTRIISCRDMLV